MGTLVGRVKRSATRRIARDPVGLQPAEEAGLDPTYMDTATAVLPEASVQTKKDIHLAVCGSAAM